MEKYSYSAEDKSFLTPPIYKFFVNPFISILPKSIPANVITMSANSFVLISFVIAYINYVYNTHKFVWLIPLLCFAYIVGDCSDGIQARRTNTGSPLGEYFDHFLDSFVTGLITGILMLSFRMTNPILLFFVFQAVYIGQIGSFWERLKSGIMRFSKFSTSESIILISTAAAMYPLKIVSQADVNDIIFGFTLLQIITFTCYFGACMTGLISIIRTRYISLRLVLHIIFSAFIGIILSFFVRTSICMQTIIITLYNVIFIESLLSATNQNKKESYPDLPVPLSCLLFFVLPDSYTFIIQVMQCIYLSFRVFIRFSVFFKKYKRYWYWKNPV